MADEEDLTNVGMAMTLVDSTVRRQHQIWTRTDWERLTSTPPRNRGTRSLPDPRRVPRGLARSTCELSAPSPGSRSGTYTGKGW